MIMKKIGIIGVYKEDENGSFSRLYDEYTQSLESRWEFVVHIIPSNTSHIEHFIEEMDAFILPGWDDVDPAVYGEDNTASKNTFMHIDKRVLGFIEKIIQSQKPILWICRWMQLLNIYFGWTLHQNITNSDTHNCWDKPREYIHDVIISPDTLLEKIFEKNKTWTNSIHHQAINMLGKWVVVSGMSEDWYIEAIEHSEYTNALWVQWHPELLQEHYVVFEKFLK